MAGISLQPARALIDGALVKAKAVAGAGVTAHQNRQVGLMAATEQVRSGAHRIADGVANWCLIEDSPPECAHVPHEERPDEARTTAFLGIARPPDEVSDDGAVHCKRRKYVPALVELVRFGAVSPSNIISHKVVLDPSETCR